MPLRHWSVTRTNSLPLRQNSVPIMPMDCTFVNGLPLQPLLCHCCHSTATQVEVHLMGPCLYSRASSLGSGLRSFPFIKGNDRRPDHWDEFDPVAIIQLSVTSPLECHSDQFFANETEFITNHANGLPICQWTSTPTTPVSIQPVWCHFNLTSLWKKGQKPSSGTIYIS